MTEQTPVSGSLLVTRNFPPLIGGMEQVNLRLAAGLAHATGAVSIAGPAGCSRAAPKGTDVIESPLRPLWRFMVGSLLAALRLARRHAPKFVVAGSGLTAPMAWVAARATGAKMVVYLHGLDIIVPNKIYQRLWPPFIRAADLVLVNSRHTARLATGRGIDPERIVVLHPGTSVPALDVRAGENFLRRNDLRGKRILLSVGRLTERKGLAEFVSAALPRIVAREPTALLLIIGGDATDALHGDGSQLAKIEKAAADAGMAAHVRILGHCDQESLSAAYQAANCHVFPVREVPGDVEGFGMVALESAAHGLRTVAFAVGGVPDAVAQGKTGFLVPPGDYAAFSDRVAEVLTGAGGTRQSMSAFAAAKSWEQFDGVLASALGDI